MPNRFLFFVIFVSFFFIYLFSCSQPGGTSGNSPGNNKNSDSTTSEISADTGGNININNVLSLSIPANSLSSDAKITIKKNNNIPQGESDGFITAGQAYEFTPGGTTFEISKPAILNFIYDNDILISKNLDPSTIQMFYFDEELGQYVNVASEVDTTACKINSYIEHFTIYLPMAKAKVAGNTPPNAALQAPIPNGIRAGSPIYIRATITDYNDGGSIAGAKLFYRKLHPSTTTFISVDMVQEVKPNNTTDTFGYIIPSSYLTSADLGTGNDIEYYVKATDNLGAVTTTATTRRNVTLSYQNGSLNFNPATLRITSGFERYMVLRARDNNSTSYNVIPETISITNNLGTMANCFSNGILFHSTTYGTGTLSAGFGGQMGNATINVTNGALISIKILDTNGNPITGTLEIDENQLYDLDTIGYDGFGNQVLVNPFWACDASLGTIDQNGRLTIPDVVGNKTGNITITLGSLTAIQIVQIKDVSPKIEVKQGNNSVSQNGTYDFGIVNNNTSFDVTFDILNNGLSNLSLTGTPFITITGADASQFAVVSQPVSPIIPGGSSSFVIRFLPSSQGIKTATVSIPHNSDINIPSFSINISGTGKLLANVWTWVSGSNTTDQAGIYGTKGVANPSNIPGARFGSISWIDSSRNLWLFGGLSYTTVNSHKNDLWKFDGTNWTWVSGSNISNQYGIYGTKGIAAPSNMPGSRYSSISWIDVSGNLWLFGGFGYASSDDVGRLNDLWKFDGTNWIWVSGHSLPNQDGIYGTKGVAASTNMPGARCDSISWLDSSGNLWLFGGQDNRGYNNDLWKFDGTNWTWVSGSNIPYQNGIYGTKGVASSSNIPGARYWSISWKDSFNNLWLFGGVGFSTGSRGWLNDLWKFDGTNWTWVSGSNIPYQNGIYGTRGVAAPSNMPGSRGQSVSWIDVSGNLWLFGGEGIDNQRGGYFNDLWKFDGTNWTWVSGSNTIDQYGIYGTKGIDDLSNIPGGRGFSCCWIDNSDTFWLFGGFGYDLNGTRSMLNDLWKYNP